MESERESHGISSANQERFCHIFLSAEGLGFCDFAIENISGGEGEHPVFAQLLTRFEIEHRHRRFIDIGCSKHGDAV